MKKTTTSPMGTRRTTSPTRKTTSRTPRTSTLKKAWVLTVDMGYGHQRAAYPMGDIAHEGIITVNDYPGLPTSERKLWKNSREGYEWISRLQSKSAIGRSLFNLFDKIQEIPPFYPHRDLSRPNIQLLHTYYLIEREGLMQHLFAKVLSKNDDLPLYCTFFMPAFAAEVYGYKGDIYCQVCDADVSRTWVPKDPKRSRIKYCAPNPRVVERLKAYGVKPENIFLTGFPLPEENIGKDSAILHKDIGARIYNLDPKKTMSHKYGHIMTYHLGKGNILKKSTHPLTLTFAIGGAGAQRDLGATILKSLRHRILQEEIKINLIAGVKRDIEKYYREILKDMGLAKSLARKQVTILCKDTKAEYFKDFNVVLRETDILWTKPSEMSFYAALGIPIIMAPSVGSQEDFNRTWLKTIGAGISQEDPRYTDEWLFEWIQSGWLARAALNGFSEGQSTGTHNIKKLLFGEITRAELTKHALPMSL